MVSIKAVFIFLLCFTTFAISGNVKDTASILDSGFVVFEKTDTSFNRSLNSVLKRTPQDQKMPIARQFLDSLGYFHIVIDSITGKIHSGKRSVIKSEKIIRNDSLPDTLFSTARYPQPFDAELVKRRAQSLSVTYAENGYPFAKISISIDPDSASLDSLQITYTINSDKKFYFSKPLFKTINKTSSALLSRDIRFKYRTPFDRRLIELSSKKLKSRAYVSNVTPFDPLIDTTVTPKDSFAYVAVPFNVEDKSGLGFEGVIGFESDQDNKPELQGKAQLSLLNIFHHGELGSLQYEGDKTKQKIDVSFSKPWAFNFPIVLGTNLGIEIEKDVYGYAYGQLKMLSEFKSYWYAGLGLNYNETSVVSSASDSGSTFYGIDFLLLKIPEDFSKETLTGEMSITIGSGIAKKQKNYDRSHVDFMIGVHLPVYRSLAIHPRLVTSYIVTDEKELLSVEKIRVGGSNSVRGYSENEFAFKSVIFGQLECIHYFKSRGSVFLFTDGGVGFINNPGFQKDDYLKMFGYGLGIRLPSKLGLMTLEWARNYQDKKSLGRVHIQFQNDLSRLTGKFL